MRSRTTRELVRRVVSGLPAEFFDPATRTFQFSNHSWLVHVDDICVLIDPCTGNSRRGRGTPFDDLDTPYLDRLAERGVSVDDIDVVFLHAPPP